MRLRYRQSDEVFEVEVTKLGDGRHQVVVDGETLEVSSQQVGETLIIETENGALRVVVSADGSRRFVSARGHRDVVLEHESASRQHSDADHAGDIASPMPGKVVKVLVAEGDIVEKGAPLIVVEAMKTEISLIAPCAGTVCNLEARENEMCEAGKPLVEISPITTDETPGS